MISDSNAIVSRKAWGIDFCLNFPEILLNNSYKSLKRKVILGPKWACFLKAKPWWVNTFWCFLWGWFDSCGRHKTHGGIPNQYRKTGISTAKALHLKWTDLLPALSAKYCFRCFTMCLMENFLKSKAQDSSIALQRAPRTAQHKLGHAPKARTEVKNWMMGKG